MAPPVPPQGKTDATTPPTIAAAALFPDSTATGTNQATAFPLLNGADHQFTTVGSSTGAVLPPARLADSISVWNGGLEYAAWSTRRRVARSTTGW